MNWMTYRAMIETQIEEKKLNVDHAEKILKQAQAELATIERALKTFDEMLDEKLGGMSE